MLDEITLPCPKLLHISQSLTHHAELMVTGPDLTTFFSPSPLIFFLNNLCVVLKDVGEPCRSKQLFPEIIALDAVRVGRVARTIMITFVEGKKP